MAGVDQGGKIGRTSEPAGRRKQPGHLITPGAVERMLVDRQEFDMGEPHVARIRGQLIGELAIAEPASALVRASAP